MTAVHQKSVEELRLGAEQVVELWRRRRRRVTSAALERPRGGMASVNFDQGVQGGEGLGEGGKNKMQGLRKNRTSSGQERSTNRDV